MGEASVDGDLQSGLQLMFPDIQTKEFQCPICSKYFSRKFTLDAHMLIHKGEKPHMCQFCGKSFRQKGTLMRHKALHSSKNLFHCSLCNRGFRQKNVFIHHLRHRHSVSTETLDRRKYRTEPKDYQSIMDTLPPFVHADSTAIASSGKHFDALLSKSIQKPVIDPLESSHYNCTEENMINSTLNSINHPEQISKTINDPDKLSSVTSHESELIIDEDYLEDIKPIFNNNAYEINPLVSSGNNIASDVPHTTNSSMLVASSVNSHHSHSNNVTSSNDVNDEGIICLPCDRSFNNESDFKCHMKTHVQSVLLGDINSSDFASHLNPLVSSASTASLNSVLSNSLITTSSNSKDNDSQIPNSSKINTMPVKIELLDSDTDNYLSSNKMNIEPTMSSSSCSTNKLSKNDKLFCPICKIHFIGVETFKKHAGKHDSYLLLKLYCEALVAKDKPSVNQNSPLYVTSGNPSHQNHTSKSLQKNSLSEEHKSRKNVMKNKLNRTKCSSKRFQCTQCQKRFLNKILYEYHHQLHLNVKGFSCGYCKKKFSSKMLLLSHTRANHFKTFSCPKCSRTFNYCKLFDLHTKRCIYNYDVKTSNGSQINFPVVSIESLLNSDIDGIVGIIPVCNTANANGKNSIKVGIPVMSVAQIKALYQSSTNDSKW